MSARTTAAVLVATALIVLASWLGMGALASSKSIKVGVLHSLSGTMAISETSVRDATLLAIEEINANGGVLGRQIEPVVVDGASDWPTFAALSRRLILDDQVVTVFGCWTSASRKTVRPIFEELDHLLIYPVQYEGLEQSPNIVYTGAAPNQQITPAVRWALKNLGQRIYLVGSDYVFPRTAGAIMADQIQKLGGSVVAERYVPLGTTDVTEVVNDIAARKPDIIFNTINGDTNVALFAALRAAGIMPAEIPTVSFSIAESELQAMGGGRNMIGDYAVWNYFQSVDSPTNAQFVARFRARFGADRVTSDPIEAAYVGVHLWARAVEQAGNTDVRQIRDAMRGQSFAGPGGAVYVDPENQHLWKTVRVGKVRSDGQFDVVWSSERPVRPIPYPRLRTRAAWEAFLTDLYDGWGGQWARPAP